MGKVTGLDNTSLPIISICVFLCYFFLWVVVRVWTLHRIMLFFSMGSSASCHEYELCITPGFFFFMGSCQSMNCASHPTWWTPSPWRSAGTALVAWRMWLRTSRKLSFCLSNGLTSSSTPLFSSLQKVRRSPSCSLHCGHVCIFCYV